MAYITLNSMETTGLPTITLHADSKPFTFVIDTGSNSSVLDKKVVQELGKTPEVLPDHSIVGIAGTLGHVESVKQTFTNDIFVFEHTFLVSNLSALIDAIYEDGKIKIHGILGTDFLTKYRCHLDFKKKRLHLG